MNARRTLVWLAAGLALAAWIALASLARREPRAEAGLAEAPASAPRDAPARRAEMLDATRAGPRDERTEARARAESGPAAPSAPEAPILLAGLAVDRRGEPLAGVEIELECWGDAERRVERASSDAHGRYQVRGSPPTRAGVTIRARKAGLASLEEYLQRFPPPDSESHTLVLGPGARVAGRVLFDDFLQRERFEVRLGLGRRAWSTGLDPEGRFEFADLPEDWAVLGVLYDGRSIEWLEGLSVAAAEPAGDPRIDPWDLRGRLREWRVRLLRPDGAPLAGEAITLQWLTEDGALRGRWSTRTDADGACSAIVPTSIASAWLDVAGFLDESIDVDAREWTLHEMPTVTIGVDPRAAELFDAVRLELVLVGDGGPPSSVAARRATIGPEGEAEATLDAAGRWQVGWVPNELGATAMQWPEHVLDVRPEPAKQYFALALDDARLAALLAAVGR